jgi:hypothetical protein
MHWYCTTCRTDVAAATRPSSCDTCGGALRPDRRLFEPELPTMGLLPSDEWVAVYQPRDAGEADMVQEYLEHRGVPALEMPGLADWVVELDPDERGTIVHIAVPRSRIDEARGLLEPLHV